MESRVLNAFVAAGWGLAAFLLIFGPAASQQQPDPFATLSMPELAWDETDDPASFVARIRAAAAPLGGDCDEERQALSTLADGLRIGADQSATAGKPFTLEWSAEAAATIAPAWLVISVDGPVRFTGTGFYALLPGAIGPFGLPDGQDRTRALVALYSADALRGGSFGIVPLRAGALKITAGLAGFVRRCGEEWSRTIAAGEIPVAVSAEAVFSVRDPFSVEAPRRIVASPDRATAVEVFSGRYHLLDRASGAILADRDGEDPRYSPTGRFLVARLSEGYELLDTAEGTVLDSGAWGDIAWENADSFMLVGQSTSGTVTVRNTPVAGRVADSYLDCTVCPGLATRLTVDLENDLLLRIGGQSYSLLRLGGDQAEVTGTVDTFDEEIMAEAVDAIRDTVGATGAAPLLVPAHWNMRGGLKLSSLASDLAPTGAAAFDSWQDRLRRAVLPVVEETPERAAPEALRPVEIGETRGVAAFARPRPQPGATPDRLPARLSEFGIDTARPVNPVFKKSSPDEEADLAIAARIEDSVPWAKGLFRRKDFGCLPEEPDRIYAYFNDVAEFRIGTRRVWLTLLSCKWTINGAYEPNFYLFDSAAGGLVRLGGLNPAQPNTGRCDSSIAACGFEAAMFKNSLLVWSRPSRAFLLYDLTARKVVTERYDLGRGDLLSGMRLAAARDTVVQFNADDSFFVHDTAAGATILEGRYVDDEILAWSPDLRFDSTAEGANFVALRFPGQPGEYTFQQYRRVLRSEGHVGEVIARRYRPGPASVAVPPGLSGTLRLEGGRLVGAMTPRNAAELRVYQDGLRTDTFALDPADTTAVVDVARVPGARWVSVIAKDRDGLVSRPLGRALPADPSARRTLHALTVGVDRYDAPGLADLRFAAADARTLGDAVASLDGTSLHVGRVETLVDEAATPAAILERARAVVAAAGTGETLVFSFAGHGLTAPDGRFYMATSGTDLEALATTALAWDDLVAILREARARVVVFLDACHSGAAGTGLFATNDAAAKGLLDQVPSGLLVFSASKGRQLSEEAESRGGGIFSNAVADVIARDRDAGDLNANGAIEASELYTGVKHRVSTLTQGRQVPWLARNDLIGDFALF